MTLAFTVTAQVADMSPAFAVISATPALTAVTLPVSSTVATDGSLLLHVTGSVEFAGSTFAVSVAVSPSVSSRVDSLSEIPVAEAVTLNLQ